MRQQLVLWLSAMIVATAFAPLAEARMNPQRNAATWYWRAFDQRANRLTDAELLLLTDFDATTGAPTPELRAALAKAQPLIELMHRGSLQPHSDFHLNRAEGINLLLPHLASMRNMVRVMQTDAFVCLHDGDARTAVERIAAIFRIGGHAAHDQVLISSLVGQAIFSLGDQVAQFAHDRALIDAAGAATLIRAIDLLDPRDPFDSTGAIIGDRELIIGWLDGLGDDPQQGVFELFEGMGDPIPPTLLEYTPEQFQHDIDRMDQMMDQMVDIFAMDDHEHARELMTTLVEELIAGEHGKLARMLMPAYDTVLTRREQAVAMLSDRREALAKLAGGEADPVEFANAAAWYLRAIDALEKLNDRQTQTLRRFDSTATSFDTSLLEVIAASSTAMELFQQGSKIDRCDFTIAVPPRTTVFMPRYLPGMRDGLRLLHAEAQRRLDSSDIDAAVELLACTARIIAHLSGDVQMLTSPTAHVAFIDLARLIDRAKDSDLLTEDHARHLLSAIDRIDRSDPFGYLASRRNVAEKLPWQWQLWNRIIASHLRETDTPENRESRQAVLRESAALIENANETTLLFLLAIEDGLSLARSGQLDAETARLANYLGEDDEGEERTVTAGAAHSTGDEDDSESVDILPFALAPSQPVHALRDVVDLANWARTLVEAARLYEVIREGTLPTLSDLSPRALNRLADRRVQARRDLRELTRSLRELIGGDEDEAAARIRTREAVDPPFAPDAADDAPRP